MQKHPTTLSVVTVVPARRLYPVREVVILLGLSRNELYALIARGELRAKRVGRLVMVPAASIDAYIKSLPEAS